MMSKKSKYIEKIANILLNILIAIFSIVLLISLYSGIQIKILGHKYANFFGYSMFEVQTNSMEDEISAGDWIIVKLTQKAELDDVITYEYKGEYVTHRVIEAYSGTYITKGDANNTKDDPVDQSQVIGKSVKVLSHFGFIRKTLLNPAVLIALIITLFLFNSALKDKHSENAVFKKIKSKITGFIKRKKEPKKIKTQDSVGVDETVSNEIKVKEIIHYNDSLDDILEEKPIDLPLEDEIRYESEEVDIVTEDLEIKYFGSDEEEKEIKIESAETEVKLDEEESEEDEYVEDDLEKTMIFRKIPVDMSELNETLLEIAKNEMLEQKENSKEKEEVKIEEETVVEEEKGLTEINLELIKDTTKKNKNLIDVMVNFKKEELNEIISTLMDEEKLQSNEASIKNAFITTYINARYYNYFNDKNIEYQGKNIAKKIEKIIKIETESLIEKYKGNDSKYDTKVHKYANLFKLIANLDQAKDSVTETKSKKEFYKTEIMKCYKMWDSQRIDRKINKIIEIQKKYVEMIKYFLKSLETNTFYLNFNKIASKKELYAIDLQHNVSFNRVYSDYIIDKTYKEGVIAEDKTPVLFTLLSTQLINDMILGDFNKKYIIYIPSSLYKKEKKILRLLKMIEDEYAKSHVMIFVSFNDLVANKQSIGKIKKMGYRFVSAFENGSKLQQKGRSSLYVADLLFVNKKDNNLEKIISYIPQDLLDNVVYDDIINKINYIEVNNE